MDYQLDVDEFDAKYRDSKKHLIAVRSEFRKEGEWIRAVNTIIEHFAKKYDVVEVLPIKKQWVVKWKGTKGRNPGKKKPISVRSVTVAEFDKAALYIIGDPSEEELKFAKELISSI